MTTQSYWVKKERSPAWLVDFLQVWWGRIYMPQCSSITFTGNILLHEEGRATVWYDWTKLLSLSLHIKLAYKKNISIKSNVPGSENFWCVLIDAWWNWTLYQTTVLYNTLDYFVLFSEVMISTTLAAATVSRRWKVNKGEQARSR